MRPITAAPYRGAKYIRSHLPAEWSSGVPPTKSEALKRAAALKKLGHA
jgi:hypothetical protein